VALAKDAKYRIGVMEFENQSPYGGWRLGQGCSDMLATSLVETGKFRVFERDKLDAILKEQDLGTAGRVTPQSAAKVGKMLGLQAIVTGAVTEFGHARKGGGGMGISIKKTTYRAGVDIRLVDATTGEIICASHEDSTWATMKGSVMGIGGGTDYNERLPIRWAASPLPPA
jgi:curli biogenesis system outer membrane secretion channel CsgG